MRASRTTVGLRASRTTVGSRVVSGPPWWADSKGGPLHTDQLPGPAQLIVGLTGQPTRIDSGRQDRRPEVRDGFRTRCTEPEEERSHAAI